MTRTCEHANSRLVDVVTVADVDAEKRVDDSLVHIWILKFGRKVEFFSDFEVEVQVRVWSVFCC